jgi:hypothetical protein
MSTTERPSLGPFADAIADWRRLVCNASPENRWMTFEEAAGDIASFVARGLDRIAAGDALTAIAAMSGIDDADRAQFVIVRELDNVKNAPAANGGVKPNGNGATLVPGRLLRQTSEEFIADFVPPDYVLDGVIQRRFLYSITGRTGSGKTAVVLLIAASVALGRKIGNLEVAPGHVFYFCGENPDDVRMRWIAMRQQMDFEDKKIDVHFFPGVFKISEMRELILAEAQLVGGVVLIIIDTSAAYFEGDEPNNNAQQVRHARMLRTLTKLPGGPCVLANCHPVKNAAADNLIPYGGGAFLNEVDGNLTCAIDNLAIEVSWQGKFRGSDFQPLAFKVRSVTHERLKDTRGRLVPTVIAEHLSEIAQQEMTKVARSHEDQLLVEIERDGTASRADYARRCGWMLKTGEPHKTLVRRTLDTLKTQKLISPDRDGYNLTEKGRKALGSIRTSCRSDRAQPDGSDQTLVRAGPMTPENTAKSLKTSRTKLGPISDRTTSQTPTGNPDRTTPLL